LNCAVRHFSPLVLQGLAAIEQFTTIEPHLYHGSLARSTCYHPDLCERSWCRGVRKGKSMFHKSMLNKVMAVLAFIFTCSAPIPRRWFPHRFSQRFPRTRDAFSSVESPPAGIREFPLQPARCLPIWSLPDT
jgi:hypothetical protein